jgi:hypothetical protein
VPGSPPRALERSARGALRAGGLAIIKGDLVLARRIAGLSGAGDAARAVVASLALFEERGDEALALFAPTGKRQAGRPGVHGLLHVLALLRRGAPADLRSARTLATAGARKDSPLREAYGWLKTRRRPAPLSENASVGTTSTALRRLARWAGPAWRWRLRVVEWYSFMIR